MNQNRKIGLRPFIRRFIEAIVKELWPKSAEGEVGDMLERDLSSRQLLIGTAHTIYAVVRIQVSYALDFRLLAGEACALYIAFAGAPWQPLVVVLAVALGALVLRDGYIHPAEESPHEAATDALVAAICVVASQALLGVAAPSLALPDSMMIRGTAISMVMLSAWRMIFRMNTPSQQPRGPALQSYRQTWRVNTMWMIACLALIVTNTEVVPTTSELRDFLFVLIPIVVFGLAYRLQLNPLGGRFAPSSVLHDSYKHELSVRQDLLLAKDRKTSADFPWSRCLEALFFFLLALPLVIALWRWFSDGAAAEVDWFQAGISLGAFVALSVSWLYIKKVNRETARALQEEIDARETSEKK